MERSHLQPQVVFQRTAKIEGESQTLLKAELLSAAVLVLYTSIGREEGRERRTISLSIITKGKAPQDAS